MKMRLVVALAGLAISLTLPSSAQQTNMPDLQIVRQLHTIGRKSDEAFLKGDAVALAALYQEDAVLVNDTGPVYGRQAIEKYYADMFQRLHYFSHETTYDPTSPHPIGTDGNVVWENGEWSGAFFLQGEDCGPHQVRGYFASINVREGNTWRVCMSTFSISPRRPTITTTNQ